MPGFVFSEYDTPESNSVLANKNSKGSSVFGATAPQIAAGAVIPFMLNAAGNGFALGTGLAPTAAFWSTVLTGMMAAPPALGTTTPAAVRTSNLQVVYTDSSGTPGNVTNNSPRGRVALAAGASTIVVTSSLVTATSAVFTNLRAVDGAATEIRSVSTAAGSFTITFNAASTGTAAQVDFLVVN